MNTIKTIRKTNLFTTSVIMLLLFSLIGFWGCEENDITNSSAEILVSKEYEDYLLEKTFEELDVVYGLKTVKNIPENIKMIEFENIEDLECFLQNVKKGKSRNFIGVAPQMNDPKINLIMQNNIRLKSGGFESGSMQGTPGGFWLNWWPAYLNVDINYNSSTIQISSQVQGFNFGMGYTQNAANGWWNNSKDTIHFHIDGTEDYYLFYEGVGRVYSNPMDIDGWYNPSTGEYDMKIQH